MPQLLTKPNSEDPGLSDLESDQFPSQADVAIQRVSSNMPSRSQKPLDTFFPAWLTAAVSTIANLGSTIVVCILIALALFSIAPVSAVSEATVVAIAAAIGIALFYASGRQ